MTILLAVLKVLGWILLGLLALVAVLLLVPLAAELTYDAGGFRARVRILGIPVRVYPLPAFVQRLLDRKKRKPAPEAEKPPQPAKPKKKLTLSDLVELVSTAGGAMRLVLRGLWVYGIRAVVYVHKDDAAATAIACGQTQAGIHSGIAVLRNFLHLHFRQLQVFADYDGSRADDGTFSCGIAAVPVVLLIAALWALARLSREKIL